MTEQIMTAWRVIEHYKFFCCVLPAFVLDNWISFFPFVCFVCLRCSSKKTLFSGIAIFKIMSLTRKNRMKLQMCIGKKKEEFIFFSGCQSKFDWDHFFSSLYFSFSHLLSIFFMAQRINLGETDRLEFSIGITTYHALNWGNWRNYIKARSLKLFFYWYDD